MEAIEAVIAGKGTETEVKEVNAGDKVATIIEGKSCNSSGTHLHFMVKTGNNVQNPFSYLKNIDYINYSGGDLFNPTGSWEWPIRSKVEFNQGFGYTWAIRNTWVRSIYSFHSGIDISSTASNDVVSTHKGILYRGSYFVNGCNLKYVRVNSTDSNIDTLYLHVNYF